MTDQPIQLPPAVERALLDILGESRQLGFLGPGPLETQLAHALDLVTVASRFTTARALDLGSGGGLPGLVLFGALPHSRGVLLDAQQRRTAFLTRVVADLGWGDRVDVLTGRAEVVGRQAGFRAAFDLVLSRSFGPPATTAECAAPFLEVGGHLVVSEPPDGGAGGRWPEVGLTELGLVMEPFNRTAVDHTFAVLRAERLCPERFPRRDGMPAKRPLWRDAPPDPDEPAG